MKRFIYKKISFWPLLTLVWTLLVPLKSFAEKINYVALEPKAFEDFGLTGTAADLGTFLNAAFQFGLAIAAALAVIMIVWGGVKIMLSESLFNKEDGKKKVKDAVLGLLLALVSWLILYIINPDILNFKLIQ